MQSGYFQKIMVYGLLLFGVIFGLVLNFSSPSQGLFTIISFFVSLFFLCLSGVGLVSFWLKKKVTNNEIIYSAIPSSFRQGILFATFVDAALLMAIAKLLTWWDVALLALSLLLLELYFKSGKKVVNPNV